MSCSMDRGRSVPSAAMCAVRVRCCVMSGGHDFLYGGEHVAYLAETERSGADGSVLACWRDPCGFDNCMSQTLDGLLDHESGLPRPAWWASKWYARGWRDG